jgi:hypothetical protein
VFNEAMEAADYAISRAEASVDRAIGHDARVRVGRLLSATILGAPLAWFIAGRHWNGIAIGGLAAGVALFAVVDVIRSIWQSRSKHS